MVPMVRRQSRSKSSSPGSELERQYEENVSLIVKNAELEAEIDDLKRELEHVRRDVDMLAAQTPVRHITEEMRQRLMLQSQAYAQQNAQNVQQMHAQALGAQGMFGWHDCTCVPGRSVLLQGDHRCLISLPIS